MARLTIDEAFTLDAPPERTWAFLTDPEKTVICLPGASLTEVVDERTYRGEVTTQVGPVTVTYEGTVVFEEVDEDARRVRMKGEGREAKGSGTASMTMTSLVESADGGGSKVTVQAEVELAGKIVRFGRGMIERVNAEVFKEFTGRLRDELEGEQAAEADAEPGAGVQAGVEAGDGVRDDAGRGDDEPEGSREASGDAGRRTERTRPDRPDSPNALVFVWRAFLTWVKELFGRKG